MDWTDYRTVEQRAADDLRLGFIINMTDKIMRNNDTMTAVIECRSDGELWDAWGDCYNSVVEVFNLLNKDNKRILLNNYRRQIND